MKKLKAALPTVCYTALLLTIALLSFLIAGKSGDTASGKTESPLEKTEENILPAEQIPEPFSYNDTFPRNASDGKQKLYGEGDIVLEDVLQTAIGNYVIVTSDCRKGDIESNEKVLSIIKVTDTNDLISSFTITDEKYFVCAQTTAVGIAVVTETSNRDRSFLHVIDYDFLTVTTYTLTYSDHIRIIPTMTDFVVFADSEKGCMMYRLVDGKMVFSAIEGVSMVEIFEYEEEYLVFFNNQKGGFSSYFIEKDALLARKNSFAGTRTLLHIQPCIDNGKMCFLTVEKSNSVFAVKYATDGMVLRQNNLGSISVFACRRTEKGIFLLCEDTAFSCIHLSDDLTTSVEETGVVPDEILSSLVVNDELYCLAHYGDGSIGFIGKEPIDQAQNALVLLLPTGKMLLYTEKKGDYTYIEIYEIECPF